jgi:hypothetical protein
VVDHVSTGEHAGDLRLRGRGVDEQVPVGVGLQLAGEELAARVVADRDEQAGDLQRGRLTGLRVPDGHAGDAVVAADAGDLAVPQELDLLVGERALLHDLGGAQLVAAVDHGDGAGELGQEVRLFHRGVAAADDGDVLLAEEEAVTGSAPGHAASRQALLVRQAQLPVPGAGRDDHGPGEVGLVADLDDLGVRGEVDLGDVVGDELGAEALGLLAQVVHEVRAQDAVREAGEVLHIGGVHQGATCRHRTLEHQRFQVAAGGVDGGRVARGARSDDDDVTDVAHCSAPLLHGHLCS